jgi:lytic cellulose monooxygenase (C1-hydroxylating)
MSKVPNSAGAEPSAGWFKIFHNGWTKNPTGGSGDDDFWGTRDLNTCCGKMDVKIPRDIASGDYLLRAEALALHTAGSTGQAQFYMTCFQLSVNGSGNATPPSVSFPGAYKASDPGILVNIHASLATYIVPGPTVYSGGSNKTAGSPCVGCESTCKAGSGPVATAVSVAAPENGGESVACSVPKFNQCGGNGYNGCKSCAVSLLRP